MGNVKICAIIVTFNRKSLLSRCLKAVINQSKKVDTIIIIDNASTDSTFEYLVCERLIKDEILKTDAILNVSINNQTILYYRTSSNVGGAGGFYLGLKTAHELNKFDFYWLMDDDGYPSSECLDSQLEYATTNDYVMPVSVDINNHESLSWATRKRNGNKTLCLQELRNDWGKVMPFIFPFNGSLLSKTIVEDVGYINPKLFIWGDDYEHYYRCIKAGYSPITILNAEFYHPINKAPTIPIIWGTIHVPFVESKLRFICLIRNWIYIYRNNHKYFKIILNFMAYSWLFIITRKFDISGYKLYLCSFKDGLIGHFERHKLYL